MKQPTQEINHSSSVLQNPQYDDLNPDPILWQIMDLDPDQIRSFWKGSRSISRSFSRSSHYSPLRHTLLKIQKLQNKVSFTTYSAVSLLSFWRREMVHISQLSFKHIKLIAMPWITSIEGNNSGWKGLDLDRIFT